MWLQHVYLHNTLLSEHSTRLFNHNIATSSEFDTDFSWLWHWCPRQWLHTQYIHYGRFVFHATLTQLQAQIHCCNQPSQVNIQLVCEEDHVKVVFYKEQAKCTCILSKYSKQEKHMQTYMFTHFIRQLHRFILIYKISQLGGQEDLSFYTA